MATRVTRIFRIAADFLKSAIIRLIRVTRVAILAALGAYPPVFTTATVRYCPFSSSTSTR